MYTCVYNIISKQITFQIIGLLSKIVSTEAQGAKILLEGECPYQCNTEVKLGGI